MATDPDDIRLSARDRRLLANIADKKGVSWRQLLEEQISAIVQPAVSGGNATSEESFYDAANRLGLIGCCDSLDSDLSTNPKHMEGFGEDN